MLGLAKTMEKCGQEKFKKLINSMKITPNKLKSIIKETIDELRTMGDVQSASLLGDPTVAGSGALGQAQDIAQNKAEVAPLKTSMENLKMLIVQAFFLAGFAPRAQDLGTSYPVYEVLETLFIDAIKVFKEQAAELAAEEAEGQQ